jgi:hypothetical protein
MILADSVRDWDSIRADGLLGLAPKPKFSDREEDEPVFVQNLYDGNAIS